MKLLADKLSLEHQQIPKFSPGEYIPVSVSKFFDTNHIYLRFGANMPEYKKFCTNLIDHCKRLSPTDNIVHAGGDKESDVFIWKHKDNFYRAHIVESLFVENYLIDLIDEGYTVLADSADLFINRNSELNSFPIQAHDYSLKMDHLSCSASLMRQKHILNFLIQSLNTNTRQDCWYISFTSNEPKLIDLYLKSNADYISINDVLRSFLERHPFDFDENEMDELEQSLQTFKDLLTEASSNVDSPIVSNGFNNHHTNTNGFAQTNSLSGDGFGFERNSNGNSETTEQLPEFELTNHKLKVKQVFDPNRFYLKTINKSDSQFEEMSTELHRHCKFSATPIDDKSSILPGHLYAAKSPNSGKWCRVQVLAQQNSSTFSCWFVDKGKVEDLTIENGRFCQLDAKFRKFPPRSVCATLESIKPKDGEWRTDAIEFFADQVLEEDGLEIIPAYYDSDRMHCYLIKMDVSMAELFTELGYAVMDE